MNFIARHYYKQCIYYRWLGCLSEMDWSHIFVLPIEVIFYNLCRTHPHRLLKKSWAVDFLSSWAISRIVHWRLSATKALILPWSTSADLPEYGAFLTQKLQKWNFEDQYYYTHDIFSTNENQFFLLRRHFCLSGGKKVNMLKISLVIFMRCWRRNFKIVNN